MIDEIKLQRKQSSKDEVIRVILTRDNWEVTINNDDLIHVTDTGMLRIVRANGRLTSVNPEHIIMVCTTKRGAFL